MRQVSSHLARRQEKYHCGKVSKFRITVVLGACAQRDKLPPLLIGKYKKLQCFKHLRNLPTEYEANNKAWVTSLGLSLIHI